MNDEDKDFMKAWMPDKNAAPFFGLERSIFYDAHEYIQDPYIGDWDFVRRTFKEMFFSLPWRPWVWHKTIHAQKAYMLGDKTILVSRETYKKLKEKIEEKKKNGQS